MESLKVSFKNIPGLSEAVSSIKEKIHAGASGAVFRRTSGVADVIVVEHDEKIPIPTDSDDEQPRRTKHKKRFVCSDFIVHAGRDAKLGQDFEGVKVATKVRRRYWTCENLIRCIADGRGEQIFVNDANEAALEMTVTKDYSCAFDNGTLRPDGAALQRLAPLLLDGHNAARYRFLGCWSVAGERAMFEIRASIFKWHSHDRVVVCDIDGTVTRSDILGYGAHLMGYEYTHEGVAEVLGHMDEAGYRLVFLTARPISAASATRHLLHNIGLAARDDLGKGVGRVIGLHTSDTVLALPQGAVLTSSLRWGPALVSALTGGPADFKTQVLLQVKRLFLGGSGGLVGGLGNQRTDEKAYLAAGIPPHLIFIIDHESQVRQGGGGGGCGSYEDLIELLPVLFPPLLHSDSSGPGGDKSGPRNRRSGGSPGRGGAGEGRGTDGSGGGGGTGGGTEAGVSASDVERAFLEALSGLSGAGADGKEGGAGGKSAEASERRQGGGKSLIRKTLRPAALAARSAPATPLSEDCSHAGDYYDDSDDSDAEYTGNFHSLPSAESAHTTRPNPAVASAAAAAVTTVRIPPPTAQQRPATAAVAALPPPKSGRLAATVTTRPRASPARAVAAADDEMNSPQPALRPVGSKPTVSSDGPGRDRSAGLRHTAVAAEIGAGGTTSKMAASPPGQLVAARAASGAGEGEEDWL